MVEVVNIPYKKENIIRNADIRFSEDSDSNTMGGTSSEHRDISVLHDKSSKRTYRSSKQDWPSFS